MHMGFQFFGFYNAVRPPFLQAELQQEELFVAVEMLSAVALINQALEAKDAGAFCATLVSPAAGLADIDDGLAQR